MSYKIRKTNNGHALTVPPKVVQLVPEGARFEIQVREEGILYRVSLPTDEVTPSWAVTSTEES